MQNIGFTDQRLQGVPEDPAVETERHSARNVVANQARDDQNVTENYGAVDSSNDVAFDINKNACFGLPGILGIIGKGAFLNVSAGGHMRNVEDSYIQQADVLPELSPNHGCIGFCPQLNALADTLTGREMLSFCCGLRGVPKHQVDSMIEFFTTVADLEPLVDELIRTYSDANKRKLSFVVVTIGNPSLLLFDDPLIGVDPWTQRRMWATVIQAEKELKSSVILTSRFMHKSEGLGRRLDLRETSQSLESSRQIQSHHVGGFKVLIRTEGSDQQRAVQNAMQDLFKGRCKLEANYAVRFLGYMTAVTLDECFRYSSMFFAFTRFIQCWN